MQNINSERQKYDKDKLEKMQQQQMDALVKIAADSETKSPEQMLFLSKELNIFDKNIDLSVEDEMFKKPPVKVKSSVKKFVKLKKPAKEPRQIERQLYDQPSPSRPV